MTNFSHWTMAQVEAHNARVSKFGAPKHVVPASNKAEVELHNEILDYCRRRGWIALHSSMAEPTARTLGEFDFTILADKGRVFFVEVKTAKGKLTLEQAGLHLWATKLGHRPHVVRSLSEFESLCKPS